MERLILSHEVISTLNTDQLMRLIDALGTDELRYVVAFRHWVSFLPSRWRQNCRRRDAQPLQTFLARLDAMPPETHPFDFAAIPERVREAGIHDLRLLSWEQDSSSGDGLLGTLWQVCEASSGGVRPAQHGLAKLLSGAGGSNASSKDGPEDIYRLFNHLKAMRTGVTPDGLFDVLRGEGSNPGFFDQSALVDLALRRDRALRNDLSALVRRHTETVTLDPDHFAGLTARLDASTRDITGRKSYFGDHVRARRVAASTLTGEDLPADLAARMWQALESARNGAAIHHAFRARMIRWRNRLLQNL